MDFDTTTNEREAFPVIIIGGGLAGLAAAVHLAAQGIPPVVLDSDSLWTGGRLAGGDPDTFDYGGQTWSFAPDHGVHAVWGSYENMRAMLGRFTQTQLYPSPGEEWINRWRREVRMIEAGNSVRYGIVPAPFHYLQLLFNPFFYRTITPFDFLSLPGFLFSMLWAVGFDPIKEQSTLEGLNMKEFFRGWTPNLRATFTGLGVNLLAAPKEQISVTALIAALRFYTVLRRDSWRMWFFPSHSHASLIQPLLNTIESNGGCVYKGITATKLEKQADNWRITVEDSGKGGLRSLYAQRIIIATNAPGAERLLCNSPDTSDLASKMIFPSAIRNLSIRLWFDASPREGTASGMFTGDFVPDNFFWLHRLYPDEFGEWHETTGGSAIEVHIYGSEALLDQPDRNLMILAIDEVQRAFPRLKGHFVHGAVRRNSRNHTQFRVPTSQSLYVETPWSNLYACGDWIGYDHPSLWMERATTTGIAAANHVLETYQREIYPIYRPKPPGLLPRLLWLFVRFIRLLFTPIVTIGRAFRRFRKG